MKRSIIIFFFLLIVAGWSSATLVEAQNSAVIEQLEVALWPDYDRRAVLVIYRIQLAADTPLPAQVQLPMPVESGDPFAVAWQGEDERLLVADYTSEVQGEWNIITLTSGSLVAQLEFYLDYELSGSIRNVVFVWPEGFAVSNMDYEVQQPIAVDDLQVVPPPERSIIGKDGLQYLLATLGQVLTDGTVRIELQYSNSSDQLTADAISTSEPFSLSSPITAEGGTPDILQILPWFLGGLGVCLVVIGGILYFQSRRKPQKAGKRSRARTRVKVVKNEGNLGVDPSTIYCHQCGTKVNVSDKFCRHCGVPLRR
jgi:hypothetical protein